MWLLPSTCHTFTCQSSPKQNRTWLAGMGLHLRPHILRQAGLRFKTPLLPAPTCDNDVIQMTEVCTKNIVSTSRTFFRYLRRLFEGCVMQLRGHVKIEIVFQTLCCDLSVIIHLQNGLVKKSQILVENWWKIGIWLLPPVWEMVLWHNKLLLSTCLTNGLVTHNNFFHMFRCQLPAEANPRRVGWHWAAQSQDIENNSKVCQRPLILFV